MPCHSNFEIYGQIFWCTHSTEASLADFFLRKNGGGGGVVSYSGYYWRVKGYKN